MTPFGVAGENPHVLFQSSTTRPRKRPNAAVLRAAADGRRPTPPVPDAVPSEDATKAPEIGSPGEFVNTPTRSLGSEGPVTQRVGAG